MIECSEGNIYYKKRKKCKFTKKKFLAFFITVCIVLLLSYYYKSVICVNLHTLNTSYAKKCCTQSVNKVVLYTLNDKVKYEDLVLVEKNDVGDIILISANTYKINYLAREITEDASLILENELSKGVPIPIMAFSGIEPLSGYGNKLNIKVVNVSNVTCGFSSQFNSMGINQTMHSIYVDITCTVDVNLPFDGKTIEYTNSVLISETVLVGKVPETLLNGKIFY